MSAWFEGFFSFAIVFASWMFGFALLVNLTYILNKDEFIAKVVIGLYFVLTAFYFISNLMPLNLSLSASNLPIPEAVVKTPKVLGISLAFKIIVSGFEWVKVKD